MIDIENVDARDLTMMFKDTIILHKNRPVYVETVIDKSLVVRDVMTRNSFIERADSEDFSYHGMNTGNVNLGNGVAYFSRTSARQYKQGLCEANCKIISDVYLKFNTKAVAAAIMNRYPSLETSIAILKKGQKVEVAFDRQFSVDWNGNLFFCKDPVGKVSLETGKISFKKDKMYLRNCLRNV